MSRNRNRVDKFIFRALRRAASGTAGEDAMKIALDHQETGGVLGDVTWLRRSIINYRSSGMDCGSTALYQLRMLASSRLLTVALSAPCGCRSPLYSA